MRSIVSPVDWVPAVKKVSRQLGDAALPPWWSAPAFSLSPSAVLALISGLAIPLQSPSHPRPRPPVAGRFRLTRLTLSTRGRIAPYGTARSSTSSTKS